MANSTNNANTITCPKCSTSIKISEALKQQISESMRSEYDAEYQEKAAALEVERKALVLKQRELKDAQASIDQAIRQGMEKRLDEERVALEKAAIQKAKKQVSVELLERDEELGELREKVRAAQNAELGLRHRERKLVEEKEELELSVQRTLEKEREKIRGVALKQADESHRLKEAEKDEQIAGLRKQIDELKRKAEQGPVQLQGEVMEIALEGRLGDAFPMDSVGEVPKGIRGADVLQRVLDGNRRDCGGILWESKRTKNWNGDWLRKAREDQRAAKAACVVIVSEAMPDGIELFEIIDGVWVCSWQAVEALASVLRLGLIESATCRRAAEGRQEKSDLAYGYLTSRDFVGRVRAMVEPLAEMQADLAKERRAMENAFSKREQRIHSSLAHMAGMYGDLQGIIGASLPELESMQFPQLGTDASLN